RLLWLVGLQLLLCRRLLELLVRVWICEGLVRGGLQAGHGPVSPFHFRTGCSAVCHPSSTANRRRFLSVRQSKGSAPSRTQVANQMQDAECELDHYIIFHYAAQPHTIIDRHC
ncbi:hypothetical protein Vafri_12970, partial [Volvox africanus]